MPTQLALFPHFPQYQTRVEPTPVVVQSSVLHQGIDLALQISDDCQTISAYRVPPGTPIRNPAKDLDHSQLTPIAEYPTLGLMYPDVYIGRELPAEDITKLITLYGRGRRYSTFRGVTTSWDQSVDRGVWTTNSDTVIFLRELEKLGIFSDQSIRKAVEVGVGGGHISATMAAKMPQLSALLFNDIIEEALGCALRNVHYYAGAHLMVQPYLGRGIQGFPDDFDLLICNPPYIPIAPHQEQDESDPYRGTGLIREIVDLGLTKSKRVLMSLSGMALDDLFRYAEESGKEMIIHSESEEIPLKIENIDRRWAEWLVKKGGLTEKDPEQNYYRYWHRLYTVEVKNGEN